MMTRKTITAPCSVNIWLYVSCSMMVLPCVSSSVRRISANEPPSAKAASTDARYMMPMRL
jgi:hypothetical protein